MVNKIDEEEFQRRWKQERERNPVSGFCAGMAQKARIRAELFKEANPGVKTLNEKVQEEVARFVEREASDQSRLLADLHRGTGAPQVRRVDWHHLESI